MSRLAAPGAALCTAAMLWLSLGTLAFTGVGRERLALLPYSFPTLILIVAAAMAVLLIGRRGGALAPCALLVLPALPWITPGMPAVFQMWSGPIVALVWLAFALALVAPLIPRVSIPRPRLTAGLLAALIYGAAAWQVSPSIPGGDEPHYLIITQSLLLDHDLQIENNHRRGDYQSYFAGELAPDFRVRGRNGLIYSIHSPGVPVLVAPAFALAGYRGVVLFLIALAAAGSALAWHLAWKVTGRNAAAWFGWAAVTLPVTAILQGITVYPDGPGSVFVLTGVWALLRAKDEAENGDERLWPWLLHGVALAALPWMHPRLAVTAGSLGALVLLRLPQTRNPTGKAVAFLAVPAASAFGWLAFFVAIYGRPDPSAPFGNEIQSVAFIPGALTGLLFDQRFGLLAYAPVLGFAGAGLGLMLARADRRRLALELLFVVAPYLLVVTHVAMWWAGQPSGPARFFAPVLSLLVIPAACAWQVMTRRSSRYTAAAALAFTVFASSVLVLVDGGRLAYNRRETYASWLEWLTGTTDLGHGLPAWFRDREPQLFRDVAVWIVALAVAWLLLRLVERRPSLRQRGTFATVVAGSYAMAAMVAIAIVWRLEGAAGLVTTPAQLQILRRIASEPRLLAVDLGTHHRVPSGAVPARLRIEPPRSTQAGGAGRNDRPLVVVPALPAGTYLVRPIATGDAGWLMIGINDRDPFALRTQALGVSPEPIVLRFPVDVRALVIRGDEQARRAIRSLVIEPQSVSGPSRSADGYARRAVRYGASAVFFMDEGVFPEPEGFWIGGSRQTSFVVQPDTPGASVPVLIRNAPVENHVRLTIGNWRDELTLTAGEERRIQLPLDPRGGAAAITVAVAAGFRPAAADPASADRRFLGIWIKLIDPPQ